MAAPFRAFRTLSLSLLLALGSIAHSAHGQTFSSSCDPLPEPDMVNQFLLTNCSNLKNPAFRKSVNGLDDKKGFRFPRHLQVVKCQSLGLGDTSFEFYQVESPSQVCQAPPPLDFDVSFRDKRKGPGGVLFFAFLASVITSAFAAFVVFCLLADFLYNLLRRFGSWLWGKMCVSSNAEASNGASIVEEGRFRAAFEQTNGVWSLDKRLQQAPDPLDRRHVTFSEDTVFDTSGLPYGLTLAHRDIESATSPQRASRFKGTCACLKCLGVTLCGIIGFACLVGLVLFCVFATLCQMSVEDVTPKGPIALPDPAGGLNGFLNDSGTGLNLTLCATETMSFYVSCPVQSCADLGEPYGYRAPVGVQLKLCPDYLGPVKMVVIEDLCYGVACTVALYILLLCVQPCFQKKSPALSV